MILRGTRVLDCSHVLAGPHCGRQLADMGAEVIKIESPAGGDSVRRVRGEGDRNGMVFINLNAGKLGLAIDLARPEGRQVMFDLVRNSDVLIENFRPGVMRRFGLDYESLNAVNPRLIMCSISAFGQTGPMAEQGGFAYSAMAMSGAMDLDRELDGRVHVGHLPVPDFLAALNAVSAIGYALLHRERTGRGQFLDISLVDCMLAGEDLAISCVINGQDYTPQRRPAVSTHRVADGYVVIMMTTPELFGRFADAIGKPELKVDPRFSSRDARIANQSVIDSIIDAWITRFPTRSEVVEFLATHRVPCAAVLSVQESIEHPQVRDRGCLVELREDDGTPVQVVRSAMRFSSAPTVPVKSAPARVGSDTRDVLRTVLGYSPDQIDALIALKAVHQA